MVAVVSQLLVSCSSVLILSSNFLSGLYVISTILLYLVSTLTLSPLPFLAPRRVLLFRSLLAPFDQFQFPSFSALFLAFFYLMYLSRKVERRYFNSPADRRNQQTTC
jgi:hypothetical protein|eukprot:COSAG06_NODE_588_length_13995_cov_37.217401_13_plen_107_part_00